MLQFDGDGQHRPEYIAKMIEDKLKKMGLDAYYAKAEWENYNIIQKLKSSIKYGIFFIYIWWGNYKYKKMNE